MLVLTILRRQLFVCLKSKSKLFIFLQKQGELYSTTVIKSKYCTGKGYSDVYIIYK